MTQPIDLTQILESGGMYHGRKVTSLVVEFDGGKMRIDLSNKASVDTDSALAKRILEVVEMSDMPLTRKQIAHKLNLKSLGGRFSHTVNAMIVSGRILERDKEITDDVIKFPAIACDE